MIRLIFASIFTYFVPLFSSLFQSEALRQFIEGIFALILLTIVSTCFVASMVLLNILLPNASERYKLALIKTPWRAFFIGLANYLFLGGISLLLLALEIRLLAVPALFILFFLTIITLLGLPGLIKLTGERLAVAHHSQMSPLKQIIWGTITLELAGLLPFIGWFILAPILLMVSFGAAVLGWFSHKLTPEAELKNPPR